MKSRARPRPWKAVRAQLDVDPTEEIVWTYGTHTTERAALTTLRRVKATFIRAHGAVAASEWRWAVVHDPEDRLQNPNEHGA